MISRRGFLIGAGASGLILPFGDPQRIYSFAESLGRVDFGELGVRIRWIDVMTGDVLYSAPTERRFGPDGYARVGGKHIAPMGAVIGIVRGEVYGPGLGGCGVLRCNDPHVYLDESTQVQVDWTPPTGW